jgi:hypothetical protein
MVPVVRRTFLSRFEIYFSDDAFYGYRDTKLTWQANLREARPLDLRLAKEEYGTTLPLGSVQNGSRGVSGFVQ